MLEYLKLAAGNLSHRKTRSVLTMIGIIIGIAAVIGLVSLGQGLQSAVQAQFSALGSDRLIIQAKGGLFGPPGQNAAATMTIEDLEVVQRSQYVRVAAGRLLKPVTAEFNDRERVVFVGSMPDENEEERQVILELTKPEIREGRLLSIDDRNKVMIGSSWADDNPFGQPMRPGQKILLNGTRFEIVGTLERTGNPGFDNAIFVNEQALRDALGIPTEYSVITAKAERDAVALLAANAITRDLRRHRDVEERKEDFTVQTSAQLLESVNSILEIIQAVLVGIAAISLVVGGIGIMNTMYTSVLERTKEIGIMKAIGATNGVVLLVFLAEAAILGLIGGGIGIALGIGFAKAAELAAVQALGPGLLQADVSAGLIAGAAVFSMAVGMISGALPAWQASRMEPAEALRQ